MRRREPFIAGVAVLPRLVAFMATARTFRDLSFWCKAHEFVLGVYELSAEFPRHEVFGLSSQLRRAAVSIAANIAEGFGRRGKPDKARFMNMAQASLNECLYYLILARDLGYGDTGALTQDLEEVSRMLGSYARAILNTRQPADS